MFQKSISGSSLALYINGRPFGTCTGISWETNAGRQPLYGLDSPLPFELAPGAQAVTARISCIRLRNDGGLEGRAIAAPDSKIALEKYIDVLVLDRVTGTAVFKINQAAVNNQSWDVRAGGILEGSFEIEGLDWENEAPILH